MRKSQPNFTQGSQRQKKQAEAELGKAQQKLELLLYDSIELLLCDCIEIFRRKLILDSES